METIQNVIGLRINELLAKNNAKQKELAKYLGVTDNTVSYFVSGKRTPNIEQIKNIATFFKTSSDYILGLSDVAATDTNIQSICKYTGLSEKALKLFTDDIPNMEYAYDRDTNTKLNYVIATVNSFFENETFRKFILDLDDICVGAFLHAHNEHYEKHNSNIMNDDEFKGYITDYIVSEMYDIKCYKINKILDKIISSITFDVAQYMYKTAYSKMSKEGVTNGNNPKEGK